MSAKKVKMPKMPKRRNMVAYTMMRRYANGRGAGYHDKRGYTRKVKHKKVTDESR